MSINTIFVAAGSEPGKAEIVASHLVEASVIGHDSHGVIRISKYVDWLRAGLVRANRHARIVTDRGALIVVEGDFGFGQVIGREAMEIAARRAVSHGMATLAIRNSGHLGRIGAWPEMLAEHGLASIHFVNTSGFGILVAPFGGSDRRLSANPIAAGAPVRGGRPVILDIATSVSRRQDPGGAQQGRTAAAGPRARRPRPTNNRPRRLLREAARRHSALWRPQGFGSVIFLRNSGGRAHRRVRE